MKPEHGQLENPPSETPSAVLEGLTLYRQEDPSIRVWLPLEAIKEYEDLEALLRRNFFEDGSAALEIYKDGSNSLIPSAVWKHVKLDGAMYGFSFHEAVTVAIKVKGDPYFPGKEMTYDFVVRPTTKVVHLKWLLMLEVDPQATDEVREACDFRMYSCEARLLFKSQPSFKTKTPMRDETNISE